MAATKSQKRTRSQTNWLKRHAEVIRKSRASKKKQDGWLKLVAEGKTRQATSELNRNYADFKAANNARARKRRATARAERLNAQAMRTTAKRLNGELPPTGLSTDNVETIDRPGALSRWNMQIRWRREGETNWNYTQSTGSNIRPFDDQMIFDDWIFFAGNAGVGSDSDIENVHQAVVMVYGKGYQQ